MIDHVSSEKRSCQNVRRIWFAPSIYLALLFLIWSSEYSFKGFSAFPINEILVKDKGRPILCFSSSHIIHFIRSLSFHDDVYAYLFLALLRWVKTFVAWDVVPTILEASTSSFCAGGTSGCFSSYSVLKKVPLQFTCAYISVVLFSDSQEMWLLMVLNLWVFFSHFSA